MDIAVVVPIYCPSEQVANFAKEALQRIPTDFEIFVCDDASPFKVEYPTRATILVNETNLGFTKTVNRLLKAVDDFDVVVVMNQDILLTDDACALFRQVDGEMIVSPKTTDEGYGDKFGSIWAISREALDRLGLLDESLKNYFSDTEYYDRAKKEGVPVHKFKNIVVPHFGGSAYNLLSNRNELYEEDKQAFARLD